MSPFLSRVILDSLYHFVAVVCTLFLSLCSDSFGYSWPVFPFIFDALNPRVNFSTWPVRLFVFLLLLKFSCFTVTLRGIPCLYYLGDLVEVFTMGLYALFEQLDFGIRPMTFFSFLGFLFHIPFLLNFEYFRDIIATDIAFTFIIFNDDLFLFLLDFRVKSYLGYDDFILRNFLDKWLNLRYYLFHYRLSWCFLRLILGLRNDSGGLLVLSLIFFIYLLERI